MIRSASEQDEAALRALDLATWSWEGEPRSLPGTRQALLPSRRSPGGRAGGGRGRPDRRLRATGTGPAPGVERPRTGDQGPDGRSRATGLRLGKRLVAAAVQEASARGPGASRCGFWRRMWSLAALYAACGFRVEGVLREEFRLEGRYVDDALMALDLLDRRRVVLRVVPAPVGGLGHARRGGDWRRVLGRDHGQRLGIRDGLELGASPVRAPAAGSSAGSRRSRASTRSSESRSSVERERLGRGSSRMSSATPFRSGVEVAAEHVAQQRAQVALHLRDQHRAATRRRSRSTSVPRRRPSGSARARAPAPRGAAPPGARPPRRRAPPGAAPGWPGRRRVASSSARSAEQVVGQRLGVERAPAAHLEARERPGHRAAGRRRRGASRNSRSSASSSATRIHGSPRAAPAPPSSTAAASGPRRTRGSRARRAPRRRA